METNYTANCYAIPQVLPVKLSPGLVKLFSVCCGLVKLCCCVVKMMVLFKEGVGWWCVIALVNCQTLHAQMLNCNDAGATALKAMSTH